MKKTKSIIVYKFMAKLGFLRSYTAKFVLLALLGTHIPFTLAAMMGMGPPPPPPPPPLRGMENDKGAPPFSRRDMPALKPPPAPFNRLTLIILTGCVVNMITLRALLRPVRISSQALRDYMNHGQLPDLPTHYTDEAGTLMADVQKTLTSLDQLLKEQQQRALLDPLTGAKNRAWCDARLHEDTLRAQAAQIPVCLVMMDLDYFKQVNDRFGHECGDQMLRHVADLIQKEMRQSDWLARWGGDEFILFLWNCNASGARQYLERLLARLRANPLRLQPDIELPIQVSLGFCIHEDGEEGANLFLKADSALYAAKSQGRDRMVPYEAGLPLISEKLRAA